jgi:hypothetical protein
MHSAEIDEILKFLQQFGASSNKKILKNLASCNDVLYYEQNDKFYLHIGSKIPTDFKYKEGQNTFGYTYYKNKNTQQELEVLPKVDYLHYYCNCSNWCNCNKLNLPPNCGLFSRMEIFRNDQEPFVLNSRFEYQEYTKIPPKFTYKQNMLFRAKMKLQVDYQQYYSSKFGPTYNFVQFWILVDGEQIVITKSKTGIPLVGEVIQDFAPKTWIYRFTTFSTLMDDQARLSEMLGNIVLNLQKC